MPKYRPLPTLKRLNELLEVVEISEDKYGKLSGLIWKVNRTGTAKAGNVAGSLRCRKDGRTDWVVKIDGLSYISSRIIYFIVYKKDPGDFEIDHKDRNTLNNNIQNLRLDINCDIQKINRSLLRSNNSGVTGLSWDKVTKKWMVLLTIKSERKYLGLFTCKVKAAYVLRNACIEHGLDKKGRDLPDLERIDCSCEKCYPADKTT